MSIVTITCTETGKAVSTGMSVLNWVNLRYSCYYKVESNIVEPCPHCGQKHVWQLEDASLLELD